MEWDGSTTLRAGTRIRLTAETTLARDLPAGYMLTVSVPGSITTLDTAATVEIVEPAYATGAVYQDANGVFYTFRGIVRGQVEASKADCWQVVNTGERKPYDVPARPLAQLVRAQRPREITDDQVRQVIDAVEDNGDDLDLGVARMRAVRELLEGLR